MGSSPWCKDTIRTTCSCWTQFQCREGRNLTVRRFLQETVLIQNTSTFSDRNMYHEFHAKSCGMRHWPYSPVSEVLQSVASPIPDGTSPALSCCTASPDQLTARERRSFFGERRTARKNSSVERSTIAGPDGISQNADRSTPPTEQETPMTTEYHVKVERLCVS